MPGSSSLSTTSPTKSTSTNVLIRPVRSRSTSLLSMSNLILSSPPPATYAHDNSSTHTLVDTQEFDIDTVPTLGIGKGATLKTYNLESKTLEKEFVDFGYVKPNIEHTSVEDDPRLWSAQRKSLVLAIVASTAMVGIIAGNCFFPAINALQAELGATDQLVAASVSLFILGQGIFPLLWSGISEIRGRKIAYILSLVIFILASAACALSKSISLFILFRIVQALGSSAVLALGAGTLADIYNVEERGTRLGVYYGVPLLGPSLGPILGGAITLKGSWRDTFWFLCAYGSLCLLLMIWLPETWRKERSLAYQTALKRAQSKAQERALADRFSLGGFGMGEMVTKPKQAKLEGKKEWIGMGWKSTPKVQEIGEVKVSLADANPFPAALKILSQKHNLFSIVSSAILFASQYSISFTSSRKFASAPWGYSSLIVGAILLSYGGGNILGSIGGGRYSDRVLRRLTLKNNGQGEPEMRIKSVSIPLYILPPFFIVYAWLVQYSVSIYAIVITLFILGGATIWIYSSTLAYVVDSNPGRSSSAVACNSLFRGIFAAVASQAAEPLINLVGTGWFYTGFAVLIAGGEGLLLVVGAKGKEWREEYALREVEETRAEEFILRGRRGSDDTL